jgi:hypothetical protein
MSGKTFSLLIVPVREWKRSSSRSECKTRITTKDTKYHEGFIPGVGFPSCTFVTLVVDGLALSS